ATQYLGLEISFWNFKDVLQKLYYKEKIETGVLMQLQRRAQMSEMPETERKLLLSHTETLLSHVKPGRQLVQGFFQELSSVLKSMVAETGETGYAVKKRYRGEDRLDEALGSYYQELSQFLHVLLGELHHLLEFLKELPDDSFRHQKQVNQELAAQFENVTALRDSLHYLLSAEDDDWVYWFEISTRGGNDDSRLYGAPLNIGDLLQQKLYKKLRSALFTSATLTVGNKFNYFLDRVGLHGIEQERLNTLNLASPFHYEEQVLLAVPTFLPEPRDPRYRTAVQEFVQQLLFEQRRGVLILFTSYGMLNDLYGSLKLVCQAEQIPLFAQGKSGSRHAIINQFKQIPHSVLLGTDSFWEGIDVPGKSLEILLITKLPFDVPSEPVIQAKAEQIQKRGGNPFIEYTIPEAVIRFRQGFGRLIRSRADYGAVIVLDNRLTRKMYGRIFLQSLPVKSLLFNSSDELWEKLLMWFGDGGVLLKDNSDTNQK
ncbi:MAG: helicase C-terminal domain-containing protein, partial [Calditrichia bacterium]